MVDRLKGAGIREIHVSAEMAQNMLAKMKSIPKGNTPKQPSVLEALQFTVKMEESLNRVHFSHVVKFFSEQDSALLSSSLQSSSSILHMITEEYLNLTVLESDPF
jgi:hypothetical protein